MLERQNDTENSVVLVLTTFSDPEQARQIGTQLVESQLIACINLLPAVESIYQWKGDVEVEGELVGIMKTTRQRVEELETWIEENHPYEQPEFLVVPVEAGGSGYLDWVRRHVSPSD